MRRPVRVLPRAVLAVLLAGAVCVLGMPGAHAADSGMLRLAHLSPDTPNVDVYVDSVSDPAAKVTLPGVGYGTVSGYQAVPPGTYTISMRAARADPASPPVLSTTVDVAANSARTVAGVGYFADLRLQILDDDLTLPPAGSARVRVVAAAGSAETLDVSAAGGAPLADGLEFAETGQYVDVPGGDTTLSITPAGGTATQLPVDLAAGSVYSVLVLDRSGGGLELEPVLDAATAPVVPLGGVETGAGGTATSSPRAPLAVAVAVLAVLGLLALAREWLPRRGPRARHAAGS